MNEVNEQERYLQPFYRRQPLHFECTQCGRCCTGNQDYHVYVSDKEVEQIRSFLGLSVAWFKRRYLQRLDNHEWGLQSKGEHCVFLNTQGQCRVYAVRPVQCSAYPFWPEVLKTAKTWQRESKRCEGINHGAVISLKRIRDALTRIHNYECE